MSDFLSLILARSSGNAKVAKPRLASRFEPQSTEAGPVRALYPGASPTEEPFEVRQTANSAENAPDAEIAKPSGRSHEQRMEPEPAPPQVQVGARPFNRDGITSIHENTETAVFSQGERLNPGEKRLFLDDRMHPTLGDDRFEPNDATLSSQPKLPAGASSLMEIAQEAKATGKAPVSAEKNFFQETPPARSGFAAPQLLKPAVFTPGSPDRDVSSLSEQHLMPLYPKTRESRSAQSAKPAIHPDQEIHVTIGRVEVRATVAEKARRTAKVESPVIGLNEYLRKQRGGAHP